MSDVGPKPRPGSGTSPQPSRPKPPRQPRPATPPPRSGHLPPGADYPMPRLGEIVRDSERYMAQALAVLHRTYDPASAPAEDYDPVVPGYVMVRLMAARADLNSALHALGEICDLDLPPVGSAVLFPARQFETKPRESAGGPSDHPNAPRGECLLPGSGAAAATAATESDATVGVASQAGSSDPRPRLSQRAPDGNGVRPGVGPITPETERFVVEAIRKHIRRHGRSSLL